MEVAARLEPDFGRCLKGQIMEFRLVFVGIRLFYFKYPFKKLKSYFKINNLIVVFRGKTLYRLE